MEEKCGRLLTKGELERLISNDFLNSEGLVENYLKRGIRTCVGCEHFIDIDFSADFREYGGVCAEKHAGVGKYKFVV